MVLLLLALSRYANQAPQSPSVRKATALPAWILWLSPVIVSPMLAVVWTSWASRPRGPVEAMETVEAYDRFRAAINTSVPEPRTVTARHFPAKAPVS